MQVAEVRRCLLAVRVAWTAHSTESPLNLSHLVPNGAQMHSFCYNFILAHHNKRMLRSKGDGAVRALEGARAQMPEGVGAEEDEFAAEPPRTSD